MMQKCKHSILSWQKSLCKASAREFNFQTKNTFNMNEAYFKHLVEDKKVAISFRFVHDVENKKVDRVFNFVRDCDENIEVSLNRIKNNLEKELTKKLKQKKAKKNQPVEPEAQPEKVLQVTAELCDTNGVITNKTFTDLLGQFETNDFTLNLHQIPFKIKFNWPWINTLTLPSSILAGFFVYPSKLDCDFTDCRSSEFIWYRGKLPANQREDQIEWETVGDGFYWLVRPEDIGYRLKLKATPKSKDGLKIGPSVEAAGKCDVQAGPGSCPFETRHLFTLDRLEGKAIRVASYNLLADYYADSEDARTKLFNYCPDYALGIDYRKQLLLKEIMGYNADIFCLQEVDFKVFEGDLIPFLGVQGMTGVHNKKGTTPEGVATMFRTDRFELVEHHAHQIGDTVKTHPACQELWKKLGSNQKLTDRVGDLGTTVQIVILKSKDFPSKFITIANTHLYFHPDADHIRLLQIGISMILVQDIMAKFKEKSGQQDLSLIFCGDFNSTPECGIYKLMTESFVPENFIDWRSNADQVVKNVSLSQPLAMKSACGIPQFTNYTVGFQECIDYIFYQSDKFVVTKVVEMPEESELNAHIAIPSVVFPSDHVAIVTDLEMNTN